MKQSRPGRIGLVFLLLGSVGLLAACTSSTITTKSALDVSSKKRPKEYFAESLYGVKASPRVTNKRSRLQRGGGRDQVGKPYQIRGKWYYPKEEPGYKKTGMASWYGDAFHGRLTANGEIYDMTHLTGAHPTMPLPSYARVTNVENGASVIVRINDRGPYERGRVVDLSHKAADMLGYINNGTAKVKVEYVGRAPLDGRDDAYLLASYMPGNSAPDPSVGMPTGVQVAMNGETPSGKRRHQTAPMPGTLGTLSSADDLPGVGLPDSGPPVMERPDATVALASMSYAPAEKVRTTSAFASLIDAGSGGQMNEYVMVGAFSAKARADQLRTVLGSYGKVAIETSTDAAGKRWFSVTLTGDGKSSIDEMLQAAWNAGAQDALTVRE